MTDPNAQHSTLVNMEVPDVATPPWPPVYRQAPSTGVHTFCHTPTLFRGSAPPRAHVRFASPPLGGSTPAQVPMAEQRHNDSMQLCSTTPSFDMTSAIASPPSRLSSGIQYELPGDLPTPRREIGQLTSQVQGNWDTIYDFMTKHEKAVTELTKELQSSSSDHKKETTELAGKIEQMKQHMSVTLSAHKKQADSETDQTLKAIKLLLTEELKKTENTLVSEMQFLVQQLQAEVQQDIQALQRNHQRSSDDLLKETNQLISFTGKLSTNLSELQSQMETKFDIQEKTIADLKVKSVSSSNTSSLVTTPVSIPTPVPIPATVVKSDHIKVTFPTFGRPSDDQDPLLYITRCQDFLALHPLTDDDILATFRTVLSGTARDWWEVARTTVTSWMEFQSAFLSAFLAEDYEDELAERVRKRTQGEKESIRDFAFSYRALCKRWKSDLEERDIVKMILKNIKPYLASHLRGHVSTVEELVRLGHQLERDHEQQTQGDNRTMPKTTTTSVKGTTSTPPIVQCWRCKELHAPGSCPHYVSSSQPTQSASHQPYSNRRNYHPHKPGPPSHNTVSSVSTKNSPTDQHNTPLTPREKVPGNSVCIPQQLMVPVSIGPWKGKAIVDTGASYTLIHESLWRSLSQTPPDLQPWTRGPLYLANGKAEVPLGWINTGINLHNHSFTIPAAVLSTHALAYAVVLGLDFIFFSGLQINVIDQKYSFKIAPTEEYPFQPGVASIPPCVDSSRKKTKPTKPSLHLMTSVPPPTPLLVLQQPDIVSDEVLIRNAVDMAHLPPDGKQTLHNILASKQNTELPWSEVDLWEEQQKDPEVTKLLQAIAENSDLENRYEVINDKLYQKTQQTDNHIHYRVYIPHSLRTSFLQHYHASPLSAHGGIFKTYKRLQEVAFWPGMWSDVKRHVKTCITCQKFKNDNQKPAGKLQQTIPTRPNQMIGVDIMGPLPRSTHQNEYLLVFVDYYTRWVELFPMRNATAHTVATIFRKEILTRWGVPDFLVSDRGVQFTSSVFKELCENWSITPKLTTAYHPQTNLTERINRNLKNMMAAYVEDNHKKWDQYLPEFRFALNSAVQETIGLTPA
ncbi:uncharacterized protein [Misgurnus anguillicaudatus]|uniref:uncharacterized protein n=1 Tax=Misgurnus anguillicaudatus TaxID=75329 RepID=UPI003CCF0239